MSPVPFPDPDPTPLPLPFAVLKALLLVSFGLHILAVDIGVGGAMLCAGIVIRARRAAKVDEGLMAIARAVSYVLPPAVTFAITLGVAPLLFVQLLYGEALYTSTILIGLPWVLFIFLLMGGYFLLYRFTDGVKGKKPLSPWIGIVSSLLLLSLGFLWTNNITLMLAPERWSDLHLAAPHGGALNLGDASVIPRFLHMTVAMVAIAGLLLGVAAGHLEDDEAFDRARARRLGLTVFAHGSLTQLVFGTTTLLLQKDEVRNALLGGSPHATGALATGVLCAIGAIVTALRGRDPKTGRAGVRLPLVLILITVSSMVTIRDAARDTALAAHGFVASRQPVVVDVVAAMAFFVAFVTWALSTRAMFVWVFGKPAQGAEPAVATAGATAGPASARAAESDDSDSEGDDDGG